MHICYSTVPHVLETKHSWSRLPPHLVYLHLPLEVLKKYVCVAPANDFNKFCAALDTRHQDQRLWPLLSIWKQKVCVLVCLSSIHIHILKAGQLSVDTVTGLCHITIFLVQLICACTVQTSIPLTYSSLCSTVVAMVASISNARHQEGARRREGAR